AGSIPGGARRLRGRRRAVGRPGGTGGRHDAGPEVHGRRAGVRRLPRVRRRHARQAAGRAGRARVGRRQRLRPRPGQTTGRHGVRRVRVRPVRRRAERGRPEAVGRVVRRAQGRPPRAAPAGDGGVRHAQEAAAGRPGQDRRDRVLLRRDGRPGAGPQRGRRARRRQPPRRAVDDDAGQGRRGAGEGAGLPRGRRPVRPAGRGGRVRAGDAGGESGLAARQLRERRPHVHQPGGQGADPGGGVRGAGRPAVVGGHEGVLRRAVRGPGGPRPPGGRRRAADRRVRHAGRRERAAGLGEPGLRQRRRRPQSRLRLRRDRHDDQQARHPQARADEGDPGPRPRPVVQRRVLHRRRQVPHRRQAQADPRDAREQAGHLHVLRRHHPHGAHRPGPGPGGGVPAAARRRLLPDGRGVRCPPELQGTVRSGRPVQHGQGGQGQHDPVRDVREGGRGGAEADRGRPRRQLPLRPRGRPAV
ncbi:MAG: dienelactone hydrolase family protein, partial [uncultured Phycisphaerae bacterium]